MSEAIGADIEALGIERGHRTLTILRKGGKIVTIPLAPKLVVDQTWRVAGSATMTSDPRP